MTEERLRAALPTWPGLFAQYADRRELLVENLSDDADDLASVSDERLTSRFEGVEDAFARHALLFGSASLGEVSRRLALAGERSATALDQLGVATEDAAHDAVTVLLLLITARSIGLRDDGDDADRAHRWLAGVAALAPDDDEELRRRAAFAALAFGLPDLVADLAGTDPPEQPFEPGRSFGPDLTGFLRYVAGAVAAGAGLADIEPAWRDVLGGFPLKLASGTMSWAELIAAARAVHALLAKEPEAQLIDRVRAQIG